MTVNLQRFCSLAQKRWIEQKAFVDELLDASTVREKPEGTLLCTMKTTTTTTTTLKTPTATTNLTTSATLSNTLTMTTTMTATMTFFLETDIHRCIEELHSICFKVS